MKINFKASLIILCLAVCMLSACSAAITPPAATGQNQLNVLVVETFLADITQNIAGERAKVETLIPLELDPHVFDPTPQDIRKITDSTVLIMNGAGFEGWAQKILDNAGGKRQVIEASSGLTSRQAREGEMAAMSDQELSDSMCAQVTSAQAQSVPAGADPTTAVALPAEAGYFMLKLTRQTDGTFAGSLLYGTDEAGTFQMATAKGTIKVQSAKDGVSISSKKTLTADCTPVSQGTMIDLAKGGQYILSLSGFTSEEVPFLVGPVGGQHQHEGDPHFWLDPLMVVKYTENIRDGLIVENP